MKSISLFSIQHTGFLGLVTFALTLGACASQNVFVLKDQNYIVRPGTLAVISGSNTEADSKLAQFLTSELKHRSILRVVSQKSIQNKFSRYPFDIIVRTDTEERNDPFTTFPGKKQKLDSMQRKLNVDYILVVWNDNLTKMIERTSKELGTTRTHSFTVDVHARFIRYPSREIIGYSQFRNYQGRGLFSSKSEGQDIDAMMKSSAQYIAATFVQTTKTEKASSRE